MGYYSFIKYPGVRWYIAVLLFFSTLICYVYRLTISILAPVIKSDLGLTNLQYASISIWFLVFYSIFQTFFGRFYDKIGTRDGFVAAIIIWTVSAMMHATAKGIGGFSLWRSMLGIGEAGNWPGTFKAISEWFPASQWIYFLRINKSIVKKVILN